MRQQHVGAEANHGADRMGLSLADCPVEIAGGVVTPSRRTERALEGHRMSQTSGQDIDQVLAVRGCLPVLAHRDERDVFPELLLQIDAGPLLLLQIGRAEPGGAQFLDARTVGPAVYSRTAASQSSGPTKPPPIPR
jgi:hypothetical protein